MIHIVIIADPVENQFAGIHHYTVGLIHALAAQNEIKVTAIVFKEEFPNPRVTSVKVPNLLSFLRNDPFRKFFGVAKAIKKLNPDIVIEPAHFGPLNLPPNIKRVTIIHDLIPISNPQFSDTVSSLLQRVFLPRILRRTNLIICNSAYTKNQVTKRFPKLSNKTEFIYPGISDIFDGKTVLWDNTISGVKPHKYFLYLGTIEPRKNLTTLLEAFTILKKKMADPEIKLLLVGNTGWKNETFLKALKNNEYHDSIIFTGYVDTKHLPMIYSNAIALVFPSLAEGFGLPLAEAMQMNCPCLISDIPVFREISGNHALFYDPKSAVDMAQTMLTALNTDQTKEIIINAGDYSKYYSWNHFSLKAVSLFKELSIPQKYLQ